MDINPISQGFDDYLAGVILPALNNDLTAYEAVEMVWSATHIFDDLIDRDTPVSDADIVGAFWVFMVGLRRNGFWVQHEHELQPLLENGLYAWLDGNALEVSGHYEAAFAMRGAVFDVILKAVQITSGLQTLRAVSPKIKQYLFNDFAAYRSKCEARDGMG